MKIVNFDGSLNSPLVSYCFGIIKAQHFNLLLYLGSLRIADEGSLLEMHIWSILIINSVFNMMYQS